MNGEICHCSCWIISCPVTIDNELLYVEWAILGSRICAADRLDKSATENSRKSNSLVAKVAWTEISPAPY